MTTEESLDLPVPVRPGIMEALERVGCDPNAGPTLPNEALLDFVATMGTAHNAASADDMTQEEATRNLVWSAFLADNETYDSTANMVVFAGLFCSEEPTAQAVSLFEVIALLYLHPEDFNLISPFDPANGTGFTVQRLGNLPAKCRAVLTKYMPLEPLAVVNQRCEETSRMLLDMIGSQMD